MSLLSLSHYEYYSQLMRVDRPIGTYLLLWPTYWALWFAAGGVPPLDLLVIFSLGVFLTRSAGCVINDYADRHFDGHVKRTCQRPLPAGKVTPREALALFVLLMAISFVLVLFTNQMTVLMSFGALALAASYPFMKRYTHFPQVALGAAFSWSIPMAFTAVSESLPSWAWVLYLANVLWTVAYDTFYAMVDRDDDLKIGVKSTAVLFGRFDLMAITFLQILMLICLIWVGQVNEMGVFYYLGLGAAIAVFVYHAQTTRDRSRDACFKAFLQNHYAGLLILLGIMADYSI